MSYQMTASGRRSSAFTPTKKPGHALLTAALLSEVISGGQAFVTPAGFTSLQRMHSRADLGEGSSTVPNSDKHGTKPLFANQYYNDEDQWGDNAEYDYEYEEQQQDEGNQAAAFQQFDPRNYEGTKRAILGGAALGTMMAINNAVGMSAVAETVTPEAPTPNQEVEVAPSVDSYSAVTYSTPEVTLPYLEKQIQEAESALGNRIESYESSASMISSAETTSTVASAATASESTSETTATFAPSFIRYTQEHMPGWIETGHKVYDAAAPKIVAGGEKIVAEVDKRVMPTVIAKEHELLGDENSAILDQTLSSAASAGKMVAGMLGKVIQFGVEGGIQVAKATPEVIHAVQDMYKTVDEKIVPEVVETSRKMQTIVDKTVPEVMDTGKHAYDTIMPEFVSAERQVAGVVQSGMDMAMPVIREIEDKVMPELNKMEREILGEEQAAILNKAMVDAAQQGEDIYHSAEKAIPQVLASGQKTVDSVAYTGQTVARAVPLIVENGKQSYDSIDRGISNAIATTQDIVNDLDRAAGKTAYVIEENLNGVTGTIDRTLPTILEAGRQVAESGSEIAKAVEYVVEDVSGVVEDVKVDNTINTAAKRFAATKPMIQEMTASVNDPNLLGKL